MKNLLLILLAAFLAAGCQKKEEMTITQTETITMPAAEEPAPSVPEPATAQVTPAAPASEPTPAPAAPAAAEFKTFYVYADKNSPDNHFIPSGYMGDYSDITLVPDAMENPHAGTTSIKITYSNKASNGARWAGIYWQQPANNWGSQENAGFNIAGATKLTFWARGEKGGERIEEFKMGGISGMFSDSGTAGIGPVVLTPEWTQYTIDVSAKNLTYVIGGFAWSTNLDVNPDGCTFYLDDIRYE
jgi:hypothetical protein